jgi:hypothetical protein
VEKEFAGSKPNLTGASREQLERWLRDTFKEGLAAKDGLKRLYGHD